MSTAPMPPRKSPVVINPPKQSNFWLILIQSITFILVLGLVLNILPFSEGTVPATPELPKQPAEGSGDVVAPPQPSIALSLVPPEMYQFSEEIALEFTLVGTQTSTDIIGELLKSDGTPFEPQRMLEIRENKVIIPASSFVGAFQVKATFSSNPEINAITNVKIAEPNLETMSMTVKPAISFGGKTVLVPGITHIFLNDVPNGMNFMLGDDPTPHQPGEDITIPDTFTIADGGAILEMQLEGVSAENGTPFRHVLAQNVVVAQQIKSEKTGTFNQYPSIQTVDGITIPQDENKVVLNELTKCAASLWSLDTDKDSKEMGLAIGYVSLANLPKFLKNMNPWEQFLLPNDIAKAYVLRPTPDSDSGCSFGSKAAGGIVYKLEDKPNASASVTLTQVIIPGYYKPAQ